MKVEDAAVRYELDEDDSYYDDGQAETPLEPMLKEGSVTNLHRLYSSSLRIRYRFYRRGVWVIYRAR